jgi:hypothetical protein
MTADHKQRRITNNGGSQTADHKGRIANGGFPLKVTHMYDSMYTTRERTEVLFCAGEVSRHSALMIADVGC